MKKLFIETYGCQMNVADSEVVASVMQMAGYETTEHEEEADAIFLNTCSIRENAESKIYNRLDTLYAKGRQRKAQGGSKLLLGVLGCMAERVKDDLIANHHADIVCGPDSYLSLPDLIAQAELGHKAIDVDLSTTETYRDVIPQRIGGNRISGFVSIMRGCNNFCHYCIVPYTRGRERSRDVESILREVHDLSDRGFKEVTLLGQNVNSYGLLPNGKRPEGGHVLCPTAASRSRERPAHARQVYDQQSRGYDGGHPPRYRRRAQPLPPHPLPGTERQQQGAPFDEPQIYARAIPGARGCHTPHHPLVAD